MSLQKKFKEYMSDPAKRIRILYVSSKHVFLIMAFLFFLSYFCISAGFYDEYFIPAFLPFYVGFILSLVIFMSMLSCKAAKMPKIFLALLCLGWLALGVFFLIPIL